MLACNSLKHRRLAVRCQAEAAAEIPMDQLWLENVGLRPFMDFVMIYDIAHDSGAESGSDEVSCAFVCILHVIVHLWKAHPVEVLLDVEYGRSHNHRLSRFGFRVWTGA